MVTKERLNTIAWGISALVVLFAFITWAEISNWQFTRLSGYRLFPLFGLIAFSLMWAHYVVAAIRTLFGFEKSITSNYFEITSLIVLIAIMLHPGLLIWQLWQDGLGLPPNSYLRFVAPGLRWAVALGTISWLVFIAYELRRKFNTRNWWKYVQYASDVAMVAVFIHALKLGSNTQNGWYHWVWLFYGVTLGLSLVVIYKLPAVIKSKSVN